MKCGIVLVPALLLALSAANASAEDLSKRKFEGATRFSLRAYDTILVPEDRKHVEELIGGMQIGLLWANTMLEKRGQPLLYCQPDHLMITDTQMIDMMRRTMKDKPKWGDFPLGMMVLVTLQRTFPCKSSEEEEPIARIPEQPEWKKVPPGPVPVKKPIKPLPLDTE